MSWNTYFRSTSVREYGPKDASFHSPSKTSVVFGACKASYNPSSRSDWPVEFLVSKYNLSYITWPCSFHPPTFPITTVSLTGEGVYLSLIKSPGFSLHSLTIVQPPSLMSSSGFCLVQITKQCLWSCTPFHFQLGVCFHMLIPLWSRFPFFPVI